MKCYAQTLTKFGEKNNEDSFAIHDNFYVLSDGAGGLGMFAKEWADTLTHNLKHFTDFNTLETEIHQLKIQFYEKQENFLEHHREYFADKFFTEGSAATLVLAGCIENSIHLISYGDSGVFAYNKQTKSLTTNLNADILSSYPELINCISSNIHSNKWYHKVLCLAKVDYLILASDAVAQYLRLVYAVNHNEKDFLEQLYSLKTAISSKVEFFLKHKAVLPCFDELIQRCIHALASSDTFEQFCKELHEKQFLDYDDYTLMIIEIPTPKYYRPCL